MGTYYGPEWLRPYSMAFWNTREWLNGPWSKEDQDAFDTLYQFGFFRAQFDKELNNRNREIYFKNTGLSYSDIKDPRNAGGSSPVVTSSAYRFVSDNVRWLYR